MDVRHLLPPHLNTKTVQQVLDWATDKVLQLDAENRKLKARIDALEGELRYANDVLARSQGTTRDTAT